jgi:hypothetical protein
MARRRRLAGVATVALLRLTHTTLDIVVPRYRMQSKTYIGIAALVVNFVVLLVGSRLTRDGLALIIIGDARPGSRLTASGDSGAYSTVRILDVLGGQAEARI